MIVPSIFFADAGSTDCARAIVSWLLHIICSRYEYMFFLFSDSQRNSSSLLQFEKYLRSLKTEYHSRIQSIFVFPHNIFHQTPQEETVTTTAKTISICLGFREKVERFHFKLEERLKYVTR